MYEVFISEIASRVESGQAIATLGAKVGFKGKKQLKKQLFPLKTPFGASVASAIGRFSKLHKLLVFIPASHRVVHDATEFYKASGTGAEKKVLRKPLASVKPLVLFSTTKQVAEN